MPGNRKYLTNIMVNDRKISIKLSLIEFKKRGIFYIYAPSLDLFGYGKDRKEAEEFFKFSLIEIIDYEVTNGTIDDLLSKMERKERNLNK